MTKKLRRFDNDTDTTQHLTFYKSNICFVFVCVEPNQCFVVSSYLNKIIEHRIKLASSTSVFFFYFTKLNLFHVKKNHI